MTVLATATAAVPAATLAHPPGRTPTPSPVPPTPRPTPRPAPDTAPGEPRVTVGVVDDQRPGGSVLALNALTGPAGPGKDLLLPPAGPTGRPAATGPVTREALDRWQATTRHPRTDRARWTIAPFEPAAPWRPATGTTPSPLLRAEDTTGPAAG